MRIGRWGWLDRILPQRWLEWRRSIKRVRRKYRDQFGRRLTLLKPTRYSEKLQWRKLFDLNPAFVVFCDKLATRSYVADTVGADYLPPLLWQGRDPDAIPFDGLNAPFVLKASHGCAQNAIVETGTIPDAAALRAKARQWLSVNHDEMMVETGYGAVPPKLLVEGLITRADGAPPLEQKIFVFHGKARVIQTIVVDPVSRGKSSAFHGADWARLRWQSRRAPYKGDLPRPKRLLEMLAIAERLSVATDHLRVDFYDCGDHFRIGELTAYSWSGLIQFDPAEFDDELGAFWALRFPRLRALHAVLFRRREILPGRTPVTGARSRPSVQGAGG